jgi:glutaminyl-tRNA synthetase
MLPPPSFARYEFLEFCLRADLDTRAPRAMVVLDPLKVTLTNWDADRVHQCVAPNFPKEPARGSRNVPLTRTLWIDRSDFKEEDSKTFYGLTVGKEAHLKYGFNVRCDAVVRDPATGAVVELLCSVDETNATKCKGNLHWVSAERPGEAPVVAEARLYDHLFLSEDPMSVENWLGDLNPTSEVVLSRVYCEPSLRHVKPQDRFQFERVGFFVCDFDTKSGADGRLVFNRTTKLKESKEKASS